MKQFLRSVICLFLVVAMVCGTFAASAYDYASTDHVGSGTIFVDVRYGQSEARTILDMVNQLRAKGDARIDTGEQAVWQLTAQEGVQVLSPRSPLTYDYNLEALAMQRAAEIALNFSHTRPNGSSCFTVTSGSASFSGYNTYGENISAGYTTAQAAHDGWAERTDSYAYQGHRRNMLNADFNAIGIAHVYYNGYHYWVQEFGGRALNTTKIAANDALTSVSVDVKDATFRLTSPVSAIMLNQSSMTLPVVNASVHMSEMWPGGRFGAIKAEPAWSVNDSTIAAISGNTVTGKKNGYTFLRASYYGAEVQIPVTVCVSHEWGSATATKEATCTEAGTKSYTCAICGANKIEVISPTGHTPSASLKGVKQATCTAEGYTGDTVCSKCSAVLTKGTIIPMIAHTWGAGTITKAATCAEAGEMTFTCVNCGKTKTDTIAKTQNHTWNSGQVTKSATCKEAGIRTYTCNVCGATKTESIAKLTTHTWNSGTVTKSATCKEEGVKTFTCTVCGATKTETIAKLTTHTWNNGTVTKASTCKEEGVKTYTCTVCGATKTESIAKLTTHTWNSGTVTKSATCKEEGVKTYTCTVCGATKTESIPKTAHTIVTDKAIAPTCTTAGKTEGKHCSVCNTVTVAQTSVPAKGHSYGSWVTTKEPTETATGLKERRCSVCSSKETQVIPTLSHTHKYTSSVTRAATCTATGVRTYTCSCGDSYTESIPKIAHTIVTDKAVAATCTTTGLTEGKHCFVCNTVTVAQQTVDKIPHSWDAGVITKEATAAEPGIKTFTCTVCGETRTETIDATALPAPTLNSLSNATAGVVFKWSAVDGAAKYRVFRKVSGGSWAKLTDTTSTSYTDTTAVAGTTYYYTVRCLDSAGKYCSSYDTKGKACRRLVNQTITSITNASGGMVVKWPKSTGAAGYYVYRKTGTGSYAKIATITSGSTVSYTDAGVKDNNATTYTYAVRAYYGSSSSSYTGKSYVRLTTPAISTLTNVTGCKMKAVWSKKSSVSGYQIQYSTTSDFSSGNKSVTVSGASTVTKTISSLTKGKTYYVRIRTYKTVSGTNYYSGWSGKKSVKISK